VEFLSCANPAALGISEKLVSNAVRRETFGQVPERVISKSYVKAGEGSCM
jgi:hypothetical protein